MTDGQNAKQQIVERIKSSDTILVTVSTDPTVDELSAALGLTIMLNSMKKHTTAVVSGEIPPAINFLDPEKTFENTVDSLRDFIIAIDKEKADHLRYKVDGDVVKIFITPYRTTITNEDLDFSQGDYNVELVIGLGVKSKDNLDKALSAHGRILHDATVATLSCGDETSNLGSIDWNEANASSLSEMLVSLSEALKGDKPLLDEQVSTALLTGIVSATDRFSNNKTTSKVMTMAAQLMAAGANQQLIAAKLEAANEIGPNKTATSEPVDNKDGSTSLSEGESTKVDKKVADKEAVTKAEKEANDGSLAISHEKDGLLDEVAQQTAQENQSEAAKHAEDELAKQLETVAPVAPPQVDQLAEEFVASEAPVGEVLPAVEPTGPTMGGTLNATTEQAHREAQDEADSNRNRTILSHTSSTYTGDSQPTISQPVFNASSIPDDEAPSVDPLASSGRTIEPFTPASETSAPMQTLAELDQQNRGSDSHADAQAAVAAAFDAAPFEPAHQPTEASGAQQLGQVDHFDQPAPAMPPLPPLANAPLPPAMPDFSVLPPPPPIPNFDQPQGPLPPEQLGQIFGSSPNPAPIVEPVNSGDPNQFQIPGQ